MTVIYIFIIILVLILPTKTFNIGYQMGRESVKQEYECYLPYYTDIYTKKEQ